MPRPSKIARDLRIGGVASEYRGRIVQTRTAQDQARGFDGDRGFHLRDCDGGAWGLHAKKQGDAEAIEPRIRSFELHA